VSALTNRKLEFTHQGERLSIEISEESLADLEDIKSRAYDAFRRAAEATFSMPSRSRERHAKDKTEHQ
jgi:hypothetical protein